jgi:hypothetical protein
MEIVEMEEYLGLMRHEDQSFADVQEALGSLRESKAVIDLKGQEADEQIGEVREMLDKHGIPEVSLSDDEEYPYRSQQSAPYPSSSTSDSDFDDGDSTSSMESGQPTTEPTDSGHMSLPRQKVLVELAC